MTTERTAVPAAPKVAEATGVTAPTPPSSHAFEIGRIRLSDGECHYEMGGPTDARPVLFIHGIASSSSVWNPNFSAIAGAGFRAIRCDLYGRGQSSKPDTAYGPDLYCRQVRELLDALNIEKVDLVGLSMGGAVSGLFTDRYPRMVRKLALIAPAGFPMPVQLPLRLVKLRGLGDILLPLVGGPILLKGADRGFYDPAKFPEFKARMREQFEDPAYFRAVLSSLRHMPLGKMAEAYRRIGSSPRETLLIWGRHDAIVPVANHERFLEAIPQIRTHIIEEAGHAVSYERPDLVNPILIDFLRLG